MIFFPFFTEGRPRVPFGDMELFLFYYALDRRHLFLSFRPSLPHIGGRRRCEFFSPSLSSPLQSEISFAFFFRTKKPPFPPSLPFSPLNPFCCTSGSLPVLHLKPGQCPSFLFSCSPGMIRLGRILPFLFFSPPILLLDYLPPFRGHTGLLFRRMSGYFSPGKVTPFSENGNNNGPLFFLLRSR